MPAVYTPPKGLLACSEHITALFRAKATLWSWLESPCWVP